MSSSLLRNSSLASQAGRAMRHRRFKSPTPPSWYQKHALMFGEYQKPEESDKKTAAVSDSASFIRTSLPPVRQCQVYDKGLWSMILQKWVRFKVSAAALREIERKGGLDEYLMLTSDEELGGDGSVAVIFKRGLERALKERNQLLDTNAARPESSSLVDQKNFWWIGRQFKLNTEPALDRRASLDPAFWEQLEEQQQQQAASMGKKE